MLVGTLNVAPEKWRAQKHKCSHNSACSVRNKWGKLEAWVRYQSCDIIGISETWWNESHGWSAGVEGYRLFWEDRQGRRVEELQCL